jgi:hypothetical protein
MKNEVKKKMMMHEHELAVPKSLNDNFCKRNVQSSDARVNSYPNFLLDDDRQSRKSLAPGVHDGDGSVACRPLCGYFIEASMVRFTSL